MIPSHRISDETPYAANTAIATQDTDIIELDGSATKIPARVIHELFPQPRLVVECTAPDVLLSRLGESTEIVLASGDRLHVFLGSYNPNRFPDERDFKDKLLPVSEPFTTRGNMISIRKAKFLVVNFLKFYGATDTFREDQTTVTRVGRLHLKADSWGIEVRAVPDLEANLAIVRSTHGYTVTHTGTIRRLDGNTFSTLDLGKLVRGLEVFLSFARSRSCGIALVQATDDNDEVLWSRWGAPRVTPGHNASQWLKNNLFHDELAQIFPSFWKRYAGSPGGGTLANSID